MTVSHSATELDKLNIALEEGAFKQISHTLNNTLRPSEVAHLIEKSPPKERHLLWSLIHQDLEAEVLQDLGDDVQAEILSRMNTSEVLAITESLETDDLADVMQQLPETVMRELLRSMDHQDRERLEKVLSYPEDTAGGLMNTDAITIRPDITIEAALRYLRRHDELPEMTDSLFVVSRKDSYVGTLPLTRMLVSDPNSTVREMMATDTPPIAAEMADDKVAQLFEQEDLVSAPVVDENNKILGRITIDDVVDVIREDADHSLMSMAGLDEDEDTFAPILKTTRRRAVWLGINLITAFIASAVIGVFEDTIEKVVALAVLMPIVASMGGIAGSQVLTLMIRGQALGHVERSNAGWLLNREIIVGVLNGLLWAIVVAVIAVLWFQDTTIGIIIGCAIVINLFAAALAGTLLPIILKAWGIDPALAGSVLLTTITDVVGFLAFLGLATFFYS
ncbi:magnesium transporter [Amphritea balenae]|uniref:Magnesium transporter MgtE n=1 Tax=Amphritea balenae TaxID=452629 RepID=A0A3P1SMD4_9GAMM|nr:magnesium transporter [Amphritea balenae]RRC98306.1 magnesium transporter [Amphritea balenae]GGK80813.1 magnesium transporter MgtE [Amphritea balenae]